VLGWVFALAALVPGCSDSDEGTGLTNPAATATTATGDRTEPDEQSVPPSEPCLEEVALPTGSLAPESPMAAADRLVVTSVTDDGCAPLADPLVALNWRSFDDADAYRQYELAVGPIVISQGHVPVMAGARTVDVLESPDGTPPTGGAYVHEEFAFPVYTSAEGFMEMLLSPEYQEIVASQQDGARQSDYVWGFQTCHVGCENLDGLAPAGTYLLHIFDRPDGDLAEAMTALAAADAGAEVFYGGELVATFGIEFGGELIDLYFPPWGNGTLVCRVGSAEAAGELLDNPAFRQFRQGTTDDLLAVLEMGHLGG
jgi:hypothetical protein